MENVREGNEFVRFRLLHNDNIGGEHQLDKLF